MEMDLRPPRLRRAIAALLVAILSLAALLPPIPAAASPVGLSPPSDDGNEVNDTNETDPMLEIGLHVMIETNWGDIIIGLYQVGAPITASNFLNLTRGGFYNGIKFHRIIDDFVIQTGDPNTRDNNLYNDGWGGSAETIPLEVSENLTHVDGAVGMARSSEPDSASSQFYICDGPQHGLDGNYAVFAVVVEGMDTVRKIATAETYGNKRPLLKDHPVDDIIMTSVFAFKNETVDNTDHEGSYPALNGLEGGITGLFALGIGTIVLVVVVFVARRVIRRLRLRRRSAGEDDEGEEVEEPVYEVELLGPGGEDDEEGEEGDGEGEEGDAPGQGWGRRWREEREWYED